MIATYSFLGQFIQSLRTAVFIHILSPHQILTFSPRRSSIQRVANVGLRVYSHHSQTLIFLAFLFTRAPEGKATVSNIIIFSNSLPFLQTWALSLARWPNNGIGPLSRLPERTGNKDVYAYVNILVCCDRTQSSSELKSIVGVMSPISIASNCC